jgi:NhaP-type Na+/H+ and K+/H+ antiporter
MRTRTALTIGVIGTAGAISTYLFNKPDLRKKMLKAESPSEAAAAFTAELEKDTADIAATVKDATMHNWLMDELRMGKDAITDRFTGATKHVKEDMKAVKNQAKSDVKSMKHEMKAGLHSAKKEVAHKEKKLHEAADHAKKAISAVKDTAKAS